MVKLDRPRSRRTRGEEASGGAAVPAGVVLVPRSAPSLVEVAEMARNDPNTRAHFLVPGGSCGNPDCVRCDGIVVGVPAGDTVPPMIDRRMPLDYVPLTLAAVDDHQEVLAWVRLDVGGAKRLVAALEEAVVVAEEEATKRRERWARRRKTPGGSEVAPPETAPLRPRGRRRTHG